MKTYDCLIAPKFSAQMKMYRFGFCYFLSLFVLGYLGFGVGTHVEGMFNHYILYGTAGMIPVFFIVFMSLMPMKFQEAGICNSVLNRLCF